VSRRTKHPFITVDIPNIPRDLFQSELFGHMKGAFSGAMETRKGLFHQANKGSLFMDEIGDMPLDLQANLLLPMEQKAVRRVGSVETDDVDIRFISATDRDLIASMAEGRFREQLYHRLRECEVYIPALRERMEDIPVIVEHYIAKHNKEMGDRKTVSAAAIEYLQQYPWPGNVRELSSVLRVALQTMSSDELEVADVHRNLHRSASQSSTRIVVAQPAYPVQPTVADQPAKSSGDIDLDEDRSLKDDLAMVDKMKIEKTLERTKGNVSKAAAILDVSRETLHNKIRKYEIDVAAFRTK